MGRREIFLKYVDRRSILNLYRVAKSDPWTVLNTDKFFGLLKELEKDKQATKEFLLVCVHESSSWESAKLTPL